jgi:hypothetical protein
MVQVPFQNVSSFVGDKLKEGVFVDPDVRKLMMDEVFLLSMTYLKQRHV